MKPIRLAIANVQKDIRLNGDSKQKEYVLDLLVKLENNENFYIPASSLTLPTDEDMFFELNKILDSDFEANEKLAKREFGLGFKRSYRWLKNKVK